MALPQHDHQDPTTRKPQYPLDSNSYKIINEIGVGVSAVVYKALCIPMNSSVVAIKSINLDQSRADFDTIRREIKTMTLLSHPNILESHCSFTVDRCLWVVMPFMSAGSLQSIISTCFPQGFSEACIAVVLKETLHALSYLHNQGHLHRDIKAGNILMDSDGHVKLADFGVSASLYEPNNGRGGGCGDGRQQQMMLTDMAGTPYWMAPEVIHSHTGYSLKADIWSFGITALELAYGCPPLSHLSPSKSLLMKITKRFRFSDYENKAAVNGKKLSKSFKEMVGACLNQDPSKRPSADKLLKHCSFFKNCTKGSDFLVKNILNGLPSVEDRYKLASCSSSTDQNDNNNNNNNNNVVQQKVRRISGWNFNLDSVFPTENLIKYESNTNTTTTTTTSTDQSGGISSGSSSEESSVMSSPPGGMEVDSMMVGSLVVLRKSLDEQREKVVNLIGLLGGEQEEEVKAESTEKLRMELEKEKQRSFELEMELGFLKLLLVSADSDQ